MTTRAKNNIHKPLTKMNLTVVLSQPSDIEPHIVNQALTDPKWRQAMNDEFDALVRNGTWELWVFRIKRLPDGSIDKYKARLVAKGFHHSVVKPTTIRLVLSLIVSKGWQLRQLDVNNAFLQGHLSEDVYMAHPPGFVDRDNPTHVCKLKKAIYGLKQTPWAWYLKLCRSSLSLGSQTFCYIDLLAQRFSIKDLGVLSYFLGIKDYFLFLCFGLILELFPIFVFWVDCFLFLYLRFSTTRNDANNSRNMKNNHQPQEICNEWIRLDG
ncbi:hypothetical protein AAG906_035460 [Vitis piasezkii]